MIHAITSNAKGPLSWWASDKSRFFFEEMSSGCDATRHVDSIGTQRRAGIAYCARLIFHHHHFCRELTRSDSSPGFATWSTNVSRNEKLCYNSRITCRTNVRLPRSSFARGVGDNTSYALLPTRECVTHAEKRSSDVEKFVRAVEKIRISFKIFNT